MLEKKFGSLVCLYFIKQVFLNCPFWFAFGSCSTTRKAELTSREIKQINSYKSTDYEKWTSSWLSCSESHSLQTKCFIDEWFTPVCFPRMRAIPSDWLKQQKSFMFFNFELRRRRVKRPWTKNRSRKPLLPSETSLSNPSDLFGLKTLADLTEQSQGNIYSCKAIKIQPEFLFFSISSEARGFCLMKKQ